MEVSRIKELIENRVRIDVFVENYPLNTIYDLMENYLYVLNQDYENRNNLTNHKQLLNELFKDEYVQKCEVFHTCIFPEIADIDTGGGDVSLLLDVHMRKNYDQWKLIF